MNYTRTRRGYYSEDAKTYVTRERTKNKAEKFLKRTQEAMEQEEIEAMA